MPIHRADGSVYTPPPGPIVPARPSSVVPPLPPSRRVVIPTVPTIIFRPGAPSEGIHVATWGEIATIVLVNRALGRVPRFVLALDPSIDPCVASSNVDFSGSLLEITGQAFGLPIDLLVADGVQLTVGDLYLTNGANFKALTTTVPPLVFKNFAGGDGSGTALLSMDNAQLTLDELSTVPMARVGGNGFHCDLTIQMRNSSGINGARVIEGSILTDGSRTTVYAYENSYVAAGAIVVEGDSVLPDARFYYFYDLTSLPRAWTFTGTSQANTPLSVLRFATGGEPVLTTWDEGFIGFNTTLGKPVYWNGSEWIAVGTGGGGSSDAVDILLEDEDGFFPEEGDNNVEVAIRKLARVVLPDTRTAVTRTRTITFEDLNAALHFGGPDPENPVAIAIAIGDLIPANTKFVSATISQGEGDYFGGPQAPSFLSASVITGTPETPTNYVYGDVNYYPLAGPSGFNNQPLGSEPWSVENFPWESPLRVQTDLSGGQLYFVLAGDNPGASLAEALDRGQVVVTVNLLQETVEAETVTVVNTTGRLTGELNAQATIDELALACLPAPERTPVTMTLTITPDDIRAAMLVPGNLFGGFSENGSYLRIPFSSLVPANTRFASASIVQGAPLGGFLDAGVSLVTVDPESSWASPSGATLDDVIIGRGDYFPQVDHSQGDAHYANYGWDGDAFPVESAMAPDVDLSEKQLWVVIDGGSFYSDFPTPEGDDGTFTVTVELLTGDVAARPDNYVITYAEGQQPNGANFFASGIEAYDAAKNVGASTKLVCDTTYGTCVFGAHPDGDYDFTNIEIEIVGGGSLIFGTGASVAKWNGVRARDGKVATMAQASNNPATVIADGQIVDFYAWDVIVVGGADGFIDVQNGTLNASFDGNGQVYDGAGGGLGRGLGYGFKVTYATGGVCNLSFAGTSQLGVNALVTDDGLNSFNIKVAGDAVTGFPLTPTFSGNQGNIGGDPPVMPPVTYYGRARNLMLRDRVFGEGSNVLPAPYTGSEMNVEELLWYLAERTTGRVQVFERYSFGAPYGLLLADLQAAGAVTEATFNLDALPQNAILLGAEIIVTSGVYAAALMTATATIEKAGDPAGSIMGAVDLTQSGYTLTAPGSNPYMGRDQQQMQMTITLTGCNFEDLTNGLVNWRLIYSVVTPNI